VDGEVNDHASEAPAAAEVAREEDPERSLGREEDPAPEAAEEVAMLPTTTQRGYGARWQRLSALARRQQPWCSHCGSTVDLVADHVDPATRGMRGITLADIQVLCRRCNGAKADKPKPKPIAKPRPRFSRQTLT
jgi:hypothetical protein